MHSGFEESYTVEFYPGPNRAPEPWEDDLCRLLIKGKQFTREIYRPLQGHEVITSQTNSNDDEDLLYNVDVVLPFDVMENSQTLLQAIIEVVPPNDRAETIETYDFGPVAMTWEDLAQEIVGNAAPHHFGHACVMKAEERFGIILTRTEVNNWVERDWRVNRAPAAADTYCAICRMDITQTPRENLTGFHVCTHVYHKTCVYQYIGLLNDVFCPACNQFLG